MIKKANGWGDSSFHGVTILTTPNTLINLAFKIGAEFDGSNDGSGKTNFDFDFETKDGKYFTVYDWKEFKSLNLNGVYKFHIGAKDKATSLQAKRELLDSL